MTTMGVVHQAGRWESARFAQEVAQHAGATFHGTETRGVRDRPHPV